MCKIDKVIENMQFAVLGLLIIGQCTLGSNFYLGQSVYLLANLLSVIRTFKLNRPLADKVKDIACLGLTIGLILFRIFIKTA